MTTKSDVIDAVAAQTGQTKTITKDIVDAAFAHVAEALATGNKVQIAGLGVFDVKDTKARTGRNPRTGEAVSIAAGRKISFKPSADLKAAL